MLGELVKKEIKNTLRDKKVIITSIIMPLVIFAAMGFIYGFAFSKTAEVVKEKVKTATLYVCDLDGGVFSSLFMNYSKNFAKEIDVVHDCSLDSLKEALEVKNYTLAIMVPEGASNNLTALKPVKIVVMGKVTGISFSSMASTGIISGFVSGLNSYVRTYIITKHGLDPAFTVNPVTSVESVLFRGNAIPPEVLGSLSMVSFMFVFAPLIVISTSLGVAASSMAVENEEKTLEVLLSLPIPRFRIVLAKLTGTMVIVLLSTASFMAGFMIYIYSIMSAFGSFSSGSEAASGTVPFSTESLMNMIDPSLLIFMGVGTFLSLTSVAALGILLGSLAPDTRTSASYIGQLSFFIVIPGFILSFLDLSTFGTSGIVGLLAISPFITPVIVIKAYFEGITWVLPAALAWSAAFSLLALYVASKLLNSERLLTLQHWFMTRKQRSGKRRRRALRGSFLH